MLDNEKLRGQHGGLFKGGAVESYQVWRSRVLKQANRLLCSNLQKKATSHICSTVMSHDAQAHL